MAKQKLFFSIADINCGNLKGQKKKQWQMVLTFYLQAVGWQSFFLKLHLMAICSFHRHDRSGGLG